mmetsp:Transcript_15259/g.40414  ORF Transcript_15259/g.40414 Transcript_15259/m.40414 type:complete len:256 (-) Transcript_15259:456-1223(-)
MLSWPQRSTNMHWNPSFRSTRLELDASSCLPAVSRAPTLSLNLKPHFSRSRLLVARCARYTTSPDALASMPAPPSVSRLGGDSRLHASRYTAAMTVVARPKQTNSPTASMKPVRISIMNTQGHVQTDSSQKPRALSTMLPASGSRLHPGTDALCERAPGASRAEMAAGQRVSRLASVAAHPPVTRPPARPSERTVLTASVLPRPARARPTRLPTFTETESSRNWKTSRIGVRMASAASIEFRSVTLRASCVLSAM